jgi:nucleoside-diphosphate-sugar epimerase
LSKNIVVTGSSGFIGRKIMASLTQQGLEAIGIDLVKTNENKYKEIEMEFFDESIGDMLNKDSIVIHLAAISTDSESKKSPSKAIETNILGTEKLLAICKEKQIRKFIFASSEWVYPETKTIVPQYETDVLSASSLNSVYAITKLVTEDLIRVNAENLDYTILRFGIVYGPRTTPGSSLENLALKVWKNENIEIGSKLTSRNFVYVDDLVSGIVQSIEFSKRKETYNLSGEEPISLGQIIDTTCKIYNQKATVIENSKSPSIRNPINDKAKIDLNWKPKISLVDGLSICLKSMTGGA